MRIRTAFLLFLFFFSGLFLSAQNSGTYLALGDSYTIGESVDESQRWPNQLAKALSQKGVSIEKPLIIAKTGWRTDELMEAIKIQKPKKDFDLVSLLIGVNNQYQNKDIEVFKSEFQQLLEIATEHSTKGKQGVFVLSIPDYGVTPFGKKKDPARIEKELQQYNRICKTICQENSIPFYDITPISKQATADLSLVADDGLHPSGKMYSLWVDLIVEQIITDLKL